MLIRIKDPVRETGRDPAAEGWERRFTADPQRAEEVIELYRRLGYEVHAEPASADKRTDECEDCHAGRALLWKTIYTRKRRS
jgi:hypothetical protein